MATRKKPEQTGQATTEEQLIEAFSKVPMSNKPTATELKQESKNENTMSDNVFVLSNGRKLELKPTKLKYFKSGDFGIYKLIQDKTAAGLLEYMDGFELIYKFLSALFDKPYHEDQVKNEDETYSSTIVFDPEITDMVENEMTVFEIDELIKAALKVNKIDLGN